MKNVYMALVAGAMTQLGVASTALAGGSGSAILPSWLKGTGSWNCIIYVTNTSNSSVDVKITLYDESGYSYTEASEAGDNIATGWGFGTSDPVGTPVSLGPRQTGVVAISSGSNGGGYGSIEWTSSSSEVAPLIAHEQVQVQYNGTTLGTYSVPVNALQPF
ncbi:hypothetical protein [Endothiovibrio diazotrophicus]